MIKKICFRLKIASQINCFTARGNSKNYRNEMYGVCVCEGRGGRLI